MRMVGKYCFYRGQAWKIISYISSPSGDFYKVVNNGTKLKVRVDEVEIYE